MRDIEDIKRTGMDFSERSAEVDKRIKKKAEELAKAKGIKYEEALNQAKAHFQELQRKAKAKKS